jgi:hypothetical protein
MSSSQLRVNQGKVLLLLAKNHYTTMPRVIVEIVQNAIDSNAQHIWVSIDMKGRNVIIADDGDGVTKEGFEEALLSVGQSVKEEGKLGQFGLGLISPLDKCKEFTFTSQPEGQEYPLRWTFERRAIEVQPDNVELPVSRLRAFPTAGQLDPSISYRTLLHIKGFTKDAQISAMDRDGLEKLIQDKFSSELLRKGVTCRLSFHAEGRTPDIRIVQPLEYSGTPLETETYFEEDAGDVEFTLFLAARTSKGYHGRVSIMEMGSNYPITWVELMRQARELLSKEAAEALGSGFFEGVIRAKNIELHENRKKFEYNDALVGLCIAIEQWFEEIGSKLYHDDRRRERDQRHQLLALRSLDRMADLLRDPAYDSLRRALLATVSIGTMGDGHNPPGRGRPKGPGDEPGIRTGQGGAGVPRTPRENPESRTRNPDTPDRPGDVPLTALGPEGRPRQEVRNDSIGLSISHFPMDEGSNRLWDFDTQRGVLHFNTRHPLWIECDKKDSTIYTFQNWMIIQVLTLLSQPENVREAARDFIDIQVKPYVDYILLAPRYQSK